MGIPSKTPSPDKDIVEFKIKTSASQGERKIILNKKEGTLTYEIDRGDMDEHVLEADNLLNNEKYNPIKTDEQGKIKYTINKSNSENDKEFFIREWIFFQSQLNKFYQNGELPIQANIEISNFLISQAAPKYLIVLPFNDDATERLGKKLDTVELVTYKSTLRECQYAHNLEEVQQKIEEICTKVEPSFQNSPIMDIIFNGPIVIEFKDKDLLKAPLSQLSSDKNSASIKGISLNRSDIEGHTRASSYYNQNWGDKNKRNTNYVASITLKNFLHTLLREVQHPAWEKKGNFGLFKGLPAGIKNLKEFLTGSLSASSNLTTEKLLKIAKHAEKILQSKNDNKPGFFGKREDDVQEYYKEKLTALSTLIVQYNQSLKPDETPSLSSQTHSKKNT